MTEERPILFDTEMVRAILDRRKTQTRRPMKQKEIKISPFGQVGDHLWMRETFQIESNLGFADVYQSQKTHWDLCPLAR